MITKTLLPVLLTICCISTSAYSATTKHTTELQKLKKEINNKDLVSAWDTAQSLKDEYLGEPAFDFLYGIVALANNQAEHAVFAFERVTANKPNWLDAQFLLAKANYQIANYQEAILLSQYVINDTAASENLKQSSSTLIKLSQNQLNKQSFELSQRISLNLGYDANINSGTTEDNIFIPASGNTYILSDASKENSDNYGSLNYRAWGSKALSQVSKVIFSGQGTVHQFQDESDYNRMFADLAAKYQYSFDFGTLTAGLKFIPLWLNDDLYRTRNSLTSMFEKKLNDSWKLTTGFEVGQTKNKINEDLNTNNVSANLNAHYYANRLKHSFGIHYSYEKSDEKMHHDNSQKITTYNYSNLWLINNEWLAKSMIAFQQKEYQDIHPFFQEKRSDDMWLFSASLQYNHSKTWSYSMNLNAQDKESNLTLFSYHRSDISLSANMNF